MAYINKNIITFKLSLLFVLYCIEANALNMNYLASVGYAHYQNINLVNSPQSTVSASMLNGMIEIDENTTNFEGNSSIAISVIDYDNEQSEDINQGEIELHAIWAIKPNSFEWHIDNVLTQLSIDPLLSESPDNMQDANAFSTGPNFVVHVNKINDIHLEARIKRYYYEFNIDNDRVFSATRWMHNVNGPLVVGVNIENEDVKFDNITTNPDFVRKDYFISVDYVYGSNSFELEAGETNIENNVTSDIVENRLMIAVQNQRSSTSHVRLQYSSSLTDTASQIISVSTTGIAADVLSSVSNDIYKEDSFSVEYNSLNSGDVFLVSFYGRKNKYEQF